MTKRKKLEQLFTLAGWNWRLARRQYCLYLLVFAMQQLAVLLCLPMIGTAVGQGMQSYYDNGMQFFALFLVYLLAGRCSCSNLRQWNGKTKAGYNQLTLPIDRKIQLAAQIFLCFVMQLGVLAWQVVLYALYYRPVQLVEQWAVQRYFRRPALNGLFYEQLTRNFSLRTILPARPGQAAMLLFVLLCAAVLIPCTMLHRGWRRVFSFCITVMAAVACAALILLERFDALTILFYSAIGSQGMKNYIVPLVLFVVVLVAASLVWADAALRRAELLS